jgi:hypothetical protein
MHGRLQWQRLYARLVSIPAVTLLAVAAAVAILSKLSIAAASEESHYALPHVRIERASFTLVFEGIASYYAHAFHGRRTAHGKRFNMYEFTAAHRSLPFGTILRVSNPSTGECLLVQINDRGPYVRRRVLDLSLAAANAIGVRLGKVKAEGFTPQDLAKDSLTLLFVGSKYEPYRAEQDSYTVLAEFTNFSHALRDHRLRLSDPDIALAVIPSSGEDGQVEFRYAVVRLSPLVHLDDSLAAVLPPP